MTTRGDAKRGREQATERASGRDFPERLRGEARGQKIEEGFFDFASRRKWEEPISEKKYVGTLRSE
jgi:hypothetical protein